MLKNIDWSKLVSYNNTNNFSFEVLCYQVAKVLYSKEGTFTPINDSGGGDGVEFYLTLSNGDQWGWQAKFYHPDSSLMTKNRKSSIEKSLTTACQKHPHLKKWFLCVCSDFTPKEQKWFEQTLPKSILQGSDISLESWNERDFLIHFRDPLFTGVQRYFFGSLELSLEWFQRQVSRQIIDNIKDKFNPVLHIKRSIDKDIHAILADHHFLLSLVQQIGELEDLFKGYQQALAKFEYAFPHHKEWVDNDAHLLSEKLKHVILDLHQGVSFIEQREFDEIQKIKWDDRRLEIEDIHKRVFRESGINNNDILLKEPDIKKMLKEQISNGNSDLLPELLWRSSNIIHTLNALFIHIDLLCQYDIHVFGPAGAGKTHLACNICEEQLNTGLPALLISGKRFVNTEPLRKQLLHILDIPLSYNWSEFLQALAIAADVYRSRIPIVIDGLHEANHHGELFQVWEELPGLIEEIAQTGHIVLITTCRETYQKTIWPDDSESQSRYIKPFSGENAEEAISRYFEWYKIRASLTASSLSQFQNPLYLRIFCESKNKRRVEDVWVHIGEQTIFDVFEDYIKSCNQAMCKKLGLRQKNNDVLTPILENIAAYLWQYNCRSVPFEYLFLQIDGQLPDALGLDHSKTNHMLHEGLLACLDQIDGKEVVFFTYDLMGSYLIARYLLRTQRGHEEVLARDPSIIEKLFSSNFQKLHPLYDDIRRCFAALFIIKTGKLLHEVFLTNEEALTSSIRALFEINPEYIKDGHPPIVAQLFRHPQNRKQLLTWCTSTIGHVKHPLNAYFWSDLLSQLTLPERDKSWTEYLREHIEETDKYIARFEMSCQNKEPIPPLIEEYLHLEAIHTMWMLSSTIHLLRDAATRALYWYGRRFPLKFLEMVLGSLSLNDPYISERMLAAIYGIVMARQHDFQEPSFAQETLPLYAHSLYTAIFMPMAAHSTTHIFARDYAKRTIDVALLHHPTLLTEQQRCDIMPPFTNGGIRNWSESINKNQGEYREGNHPFGLQIGDDDPMRWLGPAISPYHSEETEYQHARANLWWRIYDLGYSLKDFGELDRQIVHLNRFDHYQYQTDHYGKKYTQIALHELAGYREDLGLLKHDYEEFHERPSFVDIDPSFPKRIQEYNLVKENYLGPCTIPLVEWIHSGDQVDLTQYFTMDELCGEVNSWVLLDGTIVQQDTNTNRECFAFSRSFIIKSDVAASFFERLSQQPFEESQLPEIPEDHYIYAGEVPWCDTYPYNGEVSLSIQIDVSIVEQQIDRLILLRNDLPISEQEATDFWSSIQAPMIASEDDDADLEIFIGETLQKSGLTLRRSTIIEKRLEPIYQTFDVLIPVRRNAWEAYHSESIEDHRGNTVAKEIAQLLDLCSQPQTLDLFEKNGKRASLTFCYGNDFQPSQQFTYIRKDLLDRVLQETKSELIWVIRGERRYYSSKDQTSIEFTPGQASHKGFQYSLRYI